METLMQHHEIWGLSSLWVTLICKNTVNHIWLCRGYLICPEDGRNMWEEQPNGRRSSSSTGCLCRRMQHCLGQPSLTGCSCNSHRFSVCCCVQPLSVHLLRSLPQLSKSCYLVRCFIKKQHFVAEVQNWVWALLGFIACNGKPLKLSTQNSWVAGSGPN